MSKKDFFAENNVCGQNLLQLVSKGNAVIAELLRLKDYIPQVFRLQSKQDVQKYGEIILDFGYFKIAEAHEQKLESNQSLRELDEEFRDNHISIVERFYFAFESIHTYVSDLSHFIQDLQDGIYIHQSLESVFADPEGRQVFCEALYLYGIMLLIVDVYIEGTTRERLLVSYYRYTPQRSDTRSHIDEVCKLLRDSGRMSSKPAATYPEDYFMRVPIDATYVDMVIGRLRSDDIYNQLTVYPLSRHRSTALASQASMLCVCLFFSTNILHERTSIMREIVDKYFCDNWVLPLYMGYVVNLLEWWEPFKAARTALSNGLDNIKQHAAQHGSCITRLLKETHRLLKEGNLTEERVVDNIGNVTDILRECNVTIRWLMLHTCASTSIVKPSTRLESKRSKQLRELVIAESMYMPAQLFKLLLDTSQLELITQDAVKRLLDDKDDVWNKLKQESVTGLRELSDVFGGTKPLMRIETNVNLGRWFLEISREIDSLQQDETNSGRKIVQLILALEEVQEFHQLDRNLQVVQFLDETRRFLHRMIKTATVKEDTLITLQIIGDLSYAWELIDTYTVVMQQGVKREPTLCIKLRAVFLKLSSALEIPLLRINQAHSQDLLSVSQYYSGELEIYARKVLQIVPVMMFENMARIIEMQTSVLVELPTRVDKNKLKEYAQLKERFEFARLTDSISVYAKGMRMMKSTLVGVICLDPKLLLEDGIRRELVHFISETLNRELTFSSSTRLKEEGGELKLRLESLTKCMDGFKRSFEYIQDYININGLKIWQEEVTRIVNYNVEQECNGFLRNKVHDWESVYQSRHVPIPRFVGDKNFIGRLAQEIIRLTDPRRSVFVQQNCTWYQPKTFKAIVDKASFLLVASAIEITGLAGLDRLFAFMIVTDLQKVSAILENKETQNKSNNAWTNIINAVAPAELDMSSVPNVTKFYQNLVNRTGKLWAALLDLVLRIGQLQLIRILITYQLRTRCKFDAKHLESSLSLLNTILLRDELQKERQVDEKVTITLSKYFDYAGMNDPIQKIYVTARTDLNFASSMFAFVVAHLSKLYILDAQTSASLSTRRINDYLDGVPFIIAVHTIFKQFHPRVNEIFVQRLASFVQHWTKQTLSDTKNQETLLYEANTAMKFLNVYATFSKSSYELLLRHLPEEIKHLHDSLMNASHLT